MKRGLCSFVCLAVLVAVLSGCATFMPTGLLYTEVGLPVSATDSGHGSPKVGEATCTSILGLVANGDASIQAAAKAGGIKVIHHVDWKAKNIVGIYAEYTCVVYGE